MPNAKSIIIGLGPAGLAAAIAAGAGALGLEKNAQPGKKMLLSGSGQCNVTHAGNVDEFLHHFGSENRHPEKKGRFAAPALRNFDKQATVRFFESQNVPMLEREDGKIFPASLKSRDILNALLKAAKKAGAEIRTETTVESVEKIEDGFRVKTNQATFRAEKLVIATGGRSFPKTGSSGDGFRFAEQLGHRIVPPKPALTPVYVRNHAFADCAGIAFRNIKVDIFRAGKKVSVGGGMVGQGGARGDVLLTHHGLSGPGILDLSRLIETDDVISLEICPKTNLQGFLTGKKTVKNALNALEIPERFLSRLLNVLGISPEKQAAEVSREERKRLESALSGLPFSVSKLGDWNEAMATAGGVALSEVNRQTLESRLVPGLFFCGEVLDIDGDTGGYNIQFALASGFLTGLKLAGQGKHGPLPPYR